MLAEFPSLQPSQIAFVGDRILTDVVFANMNSMLSIYVEEIITKQNDNSMASRVQLQYSTKHILICVDKDTRTMGAK